jgi:hypothetical protein
MDTIKLMRKTVYFMLLMGIVQVVSGCSIISLPERKKNNKPQKYALLIGGGITEGDNFESYYKNVEYAANTLKKFGYCDEDITTLFFGGKTPNHPIVEGNATKENLIHELRHLGQTIDSNDSLVIFRSGHGIVNLILEKYQNNEDGLGIENIKCVGTESVMRFPDGDLSHLEFQMILEKIKGKQIIVILNQCFAGRFTDIAMSLDNTIIITETEESEMAIKLKRRTLRWKHDEWPFVKCIFDGFSQKSTKGEKQSVFNAYQYLLLCNPYIKGVPAHADRPLLKENPQIKYGSSLKKGTVYIY